MIITIDDIAPFHCVRGTRRWFESHGLDFSDFLKNGIAAEPLIETGDTLALKIVNRKIEREAAHE